ncbi:MAG: UxaA family hydrolase [Nitrososphaeria archaeon]
MDFLGFQRKNGVGVRNHVAILCTVGCAGQAARGIAQNNPKAKLMVHHQGCAQTPVDIAHVEKVLVNLSLNPNVHSVLLVGLGCESVSTQKVADKISKEKHVEVVNVEDEGLTRAIVKGSEVVKKMCLDAENEKRSTFSLSELTLAIKCGASDTTSGIVSNPVAGYVADKVVEEGGTVIFGETTEVIGAEHILARRAINKDVSDKLYNYIENMEKRAMAMGVDMRGGQPTGGNIKGGITTIEEKSLGAICKTGSTTLINAVDYGDRVHDKGLVFMDSPGRELEALTGFAASGAQMMLFSTGLGAPQGFPIVPVIKSSGNPATCKRLSEHIDLDLSRVFYGDLSIEDGCKMVLNEILKVASWKPSKAELVGYEESIDIYFRGPVI